jgi:surfactin synthase thioesterase subunit
VSTANVHDNDSLTLCKSLVDVPVCEQVTVSNDEIFNSYAVTMSEASAACNGYTRNQHYPVQQFNAEYTTSVDNEAISEMI